MTLAAHRAMSVPSFHAMAMNQRALERQSAGDRVIHLHVGQPATGAPRTSIDAVRSALDRHLGYTNAAGLDSLRRRISEHYATAYGLDIDPGRIIVVAGASAGFTLGFIASFDTGARVGVVEPGYPCYRNGLVALDLEPVRIAVGADEHWGPTIELLEAAGPLDGLIIASPSNPTGRVLPPNQLADLADWCRDSGVTLIADEIYHGITYGEPASTLLAHTDEVIVVNSFSKYFSMTGWRVGWMVVPEQLIGAVTRLQENLYICAPHISQVAAVAAFDATEELDRHVARYAVNRRRLLDGLGAIGLTEVADADGAFYVYADVAHLISEPSMTAMDLSLEWLEAIGVATTPGIDFDLDRGDRFIRFSYCGPTAAIDEACERLATWSRGR